MLTASTTLLRGSGLIIVALGFPLFIRCCAEYQRLICANTLINNNRKLTTEMAFRLAKVFDTTVDFWLNLQAAVDLWEVENNMRTQEELGRIETVAEYLARREERTKKVA